MSIEIREALAQDLDFLDKSCIDLVHHIQESTQDPYFQEMEESYQDNVRDMIRHFLESEMSQILLATKDGKYLGFIVGQVKVPFLSISRIKQVGEIVLCWVEPESRGAGVAKRLTDAIEQFFAYRGIRFVDLHYVTGNREAEAVWERLGYHSCRVLARKQLSDP